MHILGFRRWDLGDFLHYYYFLMHWVFFLKTDFQQSFSEEFSLCQEWLTVKMNQSWFLRTLSSAGRGTLVFWLLPYPLTPTPRQFPSSLKYLLQKLRDQTSLNEVLIFTAHSTWDSVISVSPFHWHPLWKNGKTLNIIFTTVFPICVR